MCDTIRVRLPESFCRVLVEVLLVLANRVTFADRALVILVSTLISGREDDDTGHLWYSPVVVRGCAGGCIPDVSPDRDLIHCAERNEGRERPRESTYSIRPSLSPSEM